MVIWLYVSSNQYFPLSQQFPANVNQVKNGLKWLKNNLLATFTYTQNHFNSFIYYTLFITHKLCRNAAPKNVVQVKNDKN
jgi:hypothetical protein